MSNNDNNRVLQRIGARELKPEEMQKVNGTGANVPALFTEFITGGGRDHLFDR